MPPLVRNCGAQRLDQPKLLTTCQQLGAEHTPRTRNVRSASTTRQPFARNSPRSASANHKWRAFARNTTDCVDRAPDMHAPQTLHCTKLWRNANRLTGNNCLACEVGNRLPEMLREVCTVHQKCILREHPSATVRQKCGQKDEALRRKRALRSSAPRTLRELLALSL